MSAQLARRGGGASVALQLALLDGDLRSARRGEYVATPPWFVRALLRSAGLWPWDRRILDAGAGLGEIGCEVERWAGETRPGHPPTIRAVEKEPDRSLEQPARWERDCADLFDWAPEADRNGMRFPLILTNPPFSLWKEWISALLPLLEQGGRLFVVMPGEYVSRCDRWWKQNPARRVWRTSRRPWKNETRECCWVEWERCYHGPTLLEWLEVGR